jgi:YVTN family beta-propeller protein
MSFRRAAQFAILLFATLICVSCGQVYRPVVIPTTTTPPNPSNFHEVFALNANVPANPGSAFQIDVSGDTDVAATTGMETPNHIGVNPTHAVILSNNSRLYVASAGSMSTGGVDTVSVFSPAADSSTATGFGNVSAVTLPTGSLPVFLSTTQTNAVYVANFGSAGSSSPDCVTGCVAVIGTSTNVISRIVPAGVNPVSLAATPNGTKLYVANQGDNTVSSFNTLDMSPNTVTGFSGNTPVWVVARGDNQKIYVLTQGDGNLVTIDTVTDTVSSSLPVGAGANYMSYDVHLNRLYVTNPTTSMVYVFSTTGGTGDTPTQLAAISLTLGTTPPCPAGCIPVSVTALPDGSRFYVASYQTASPCPDPTVVDSTGASVPCVIPQVTVFDAHSLTVKIPSISLLMPLQFATGQYAVPRLSSCDPSPTTYQPGFVRFRLSTASANDSSRVYVGICDAGAVAIINTTTSSTSTGTNNTPDTLAADLPAPFSAGPPGTNGQPPPQNPIFLLSGQ